MDHPSIHHITLTPTLSSPHTLSPLPHPLLLSLNHVHPLILIRQPLLNSTDNLALLAPRSLHIRALESQTSNHNRHRETLRIDTCLHEFLRRVHRTPAHESESRCHARHPRARDNRISVLVRPVQGALSLRSLGVQLVEQGLALVVVAAVWMVGFLVGTAAAVGADDCCEGAG